MLTTNSNAAVFKTSGRQWRAHVCVRACPCACQSACLCALVTASHLTVLLFRIFFLPAVSTFALALLSAVSFISRTAARALAGIHTHARMIKRKQLLHFPAKPNGGRAFSCSHVLFLFVCGCVCACANMRMQNASSAAAQTFAFRHGKIHKMKQSKSKIESINNDAYAHLFQRGKTNKYSNEKTNTERNVMARQ